MNWFRDKKRHRTGGIGAALVLIVGGGVCSGQAVPEAQMEVSRSQQPGSQSRIAVANKVSSVPDYEALAKNYGGVVEPPKAPIAKLLAKAKAGDANAQYSLGITYLLGLGVSRDDAKAFFWNRKAAAQGNAYAQCILGGQYERGDGIQQDYTQAIVWYRKSALQGYEAAQYNLGSAYESGNGVPEDYAQAAYWYRKAADQGNAEAQYNLAYLYGTGQGVSLDYAQAVYWCRKAAEQGDAWAQRNLGSLYANGDGVQRDYAHAAYWYRKAADQGDAEAQSHLVAVQESLGEISEKQRERRIRILIAASGVAFLTGAAITLFCFRQKLFSYLKKLVPRTPRAKQLAVLLPVASWCSACCLYQALDPRLMRHPINAAVTALLFSTPALIFGAVSLWWLSQAKKTG